MGGHLCGVLLPENGRRSFVNHCLEPRSKRRDRAELQANVRHFELSRKWIAARMRTCQCMSHFVYNLRSRPLVRDLAAHVRGQIASDHCRSDLITGLTHWARAGYPFPEVNLPEWSQQLLLVASAVGLWCFTAGCHVKSPLFPNPLSNRGALHDKRKHHQECPIRLGKFSRMRNHSISKPATAELGRARLAFSSINTCAAGPRPDLSSRRCCKLRLKLLLVDQLAKNT